MASVTHVKHANGSHSIGVKIDGQFVPFATVPDDRVAQLVAQAAADKTGTSDNTDNTDEESE